MLTMGLLVSTHVILVLGGIARAKGRIAQYQACGIAALACIPSIVSACLDGMTSVASLYAALGALNAWVWWNGGGDDGTRRRLKSWARRFQGVRRTAPQGAS